jgi:hypothetical protein
LRQRGRQFLGLGGILCPAGDWEPWGSWAWFSHLLRLILKASELIAADKESANLNIACFMISANHHLLAKGPGLNLYPGSSGNRQLIN